jgi:hypothetical protein
MEEECGGGQMRRRENREERKQGRLEKTTIK